MKRLLLLLLCALPLSARVLSYSPYTDQLAVRGDQLRTTRHFVLIETDPNDRDIKRGQVLLLDSKGIDPPRVIFPRGHIYFAALFQERDDLPPTILVGTPDPATHISSNGGRTWRRIKELDGLEPHQPEDVDYGGPWTRGLSASVRIGTAAFPFVVSYNRAVYAIPRSGSPRLLVKTIPDSRNRLIGQNRDGTEFVIITGPHTFAAVGLDGRSRPLGRPLADMDAAWITPDGSVYAIVHDFYEESRFRHDRRELHLYRNRRSQRIYAADWSATVVAVPTHDFRGAWISEAYGRNQTTLWRHLPGGGMETMWEVFQDEKDAPEIEALHAGASGENVLIQVHRPRAVQASFIDPALAVWRVGDPAPAAYDELFLREGPYKGFVHVDVDKMAAGDLFVFDSSFVRPPPPEPVSAPIGGGGDVMQEWGVVRGSLVQRLVIPGAIRTPAEWRTDLTIYNPLETPQQVAVTFGEITKTLTIDPAEIRVVRDALATLFGIEEGSGTLHFVPEEGMDVKARVYTGRDGGSRGYLMGAIDFFNVASPRFPVTFAGAFPGAGFATRLLLTDTSGGGLKTDLTTTSATGIIGTASVATKNVRQETVRSETPGSLIVRPTAGMGIAGVVTVDERSGDPTYFPPDLSATDVRTLPFLAHIEEADGSILRSDLHLLNFSNRSREITLEVKPYGPNQTPRRQIYVLRAYESRILADPLLTVFGLTGVARLRYWCYGSLGDTSGVRLTSRAYRTGPDGGTAGTLVPPMNNFQSVTYGESLELLAPVGDFRVTFGLVEISSAPRGAETRVRIMIYDERSVLLGTFDVPLPMATAFVIDDLFKERNIHPPAAARIVVAPLDNRGLVSAYAVLNDRVTNDLSFVAPNLGARD